VKYINYQLKERNTMEILLTVILAVTAVAIVLVFLARKTHAAPPTANKR